MRTDAKIGFAIGGVLLAVLTVYAIVVPKHTSTKKTGTVALVNPMPTGSDTPAPPALAGTESSTTQLPVGSSHETGSGLAHSDSGMTSPAPLPGTPGASDLTAGGNGAGNGVGNSAGSGGGVIKPDDRALDRSVDLTPGKAGSGDKTAAAKHSKDERRKSNSTDVAEGATTGDRSYTIKAGQTLSSIAYEVYGNSRFFVAIQRENRGLDPLHLKPGMKIKLPDITPPTVEPTGGIADAPGDHVLPLVEITPSHTHSSPTVVSSDGRTTYTVKSGDNLYAIARKLLGSGRRADALYELNKDLIGPDQSRLKLGMVLKLPEAARTAVAE